MSHIKLTKADGDVLIISPASITAILASTYLKAEEDAPPQMSAVLTTLRGVSGYPLKMTAREVRAIVDANISRPAPGITLRKKKPGADLPVWLTLESQGDLTFIRDGTVEAYEGAALKDQVEEGSDAEPPKVYRVFFKRHDGQVVFHDVDQTPHNAEVLDKSIERGNQ